MLRHSGGLAVVDFGLAREQGAFESSETFRPVGAMSHCAPEKWLQPSEAGPQSDVYSVGVMFYKLLTGTSPFWAETYIQLYERMKEGSFEPASQKNPAVPTFFNLPIHEMMQPDPARRPRNASFARRIIEHVVALEELRVKQLNSASHRSQSGVPAVAEERHAADGHPLRR